MNTNLLDRAMNFAIKAHEGVERRGTDIPYSTHVMEALSICSTMTSDPEILAAAVLHDVVEDTKFTYNDIEKEFGKRVMELVKSESDELVEVDPKMNWYERKSAGIKRVKDGTREEQIVALSDKLSNLRAIYRDYKTLGLEFFNRFHESDPAMHKWRFNELVKAFDKVQDTFAYEEFVELFHRTFDEIGIKDEIVVSDGRYFLNGHITKQMFIDVEESIPSDKLTKFDLTNCLYVDYTLIHHLFKFAKQNYRFQFLNCNERVFGILVQAGLTTYYSVLKAPRPYSLANHEAYGEGHTSLVYTTEDHDSIAKVYRPFIPMDSIETEKLSALGVASLGFDTPLSGELIQVGDMHGITFEQINGKKSIARCIADDLEHLDFYVTEFAKRCYKLHHTKCKKTYFGNILDRYYEAINNCGFDEETKEKCRELLKTIPESDMCTHGDMHIGNMITVNNRYMFIDLADFAYGNPIFDIGTFYFIITQVDRPRFENMFHFSFDYSKQVWDAFIKEYYKDYTKEEFEEEFKKIKIASGFQMIFYFSRGDWCDQKAKWVYHTLFE